jgi:pimeloyl-ACP methyl ester carboxylesterase
MRVVFVHGACVRDGAWWWHRTAELLAQEGVASETPALPSCGETGQPASGAGPGLAEDVDAVRTVLTASAEPTVLVGHSYGGIVATEAAAGLESVQHLLFVSSYLPEIGESLSTFGPDEPAPFLEVDPDAGTFTVRTDALAPVFLQDCDAEVQAAAEARTARQSVAVLDQPVRAAAWEDVPSTYLVCTDDRGTPAERQRAFAARAGRVVELGTGHHPFLSQPAAVRDLVLGLRGGRRRAGPTGGGGGSGADRDEGAAGVPGPDEASRLRGHGDEAPRDQRDLVPVHDEPSRPAEHRVGVLDAVVEMVVRLGPGTGREHDLVEAEVRDAEVLVQALVVRAGGGVGPAADRDLGRVHDREAHPASVRTGEARTAGTPVLARPRRFPRRTAGLSL